MKRRLIWLVVVMSGLWGAGAHAEVVERIAALVGDDVVLLSEVRDQTQAYEASWSGLPAPQQAAKRAEVERKVLDDIISDRLLTQQITELKVKISDQEIDEAMQEVMERNRIPDLATFKELVARQGIDWKGYREEIAKQLKRNQFIQAKVGMRIKVSDDEVRDAYDKEQSMATREYEYHARHILFRAAKNAPADEANAQRGKAEDARRRALAGEDFATLAQTLSEAPDARYGGDLGFFQKGVMVHEFEEAVMALGVGDISPVIRTPFGFHVIKLEERRPLPGKEFDAVKEEIRSRLREEAANREMKTYLAQLRQKAFIDIKLDKPAKHTTGIEAAPAPTPVSAPEPEKKEERHDAKP